MSIDSWVLPQASPEHPSLHHPDERPMGPHALDPGPGQNSWGAEATVVLLDQLRVSLRRRPVRGPSMMARAIVRNCRPASRPSLTAAGLLHATYWPTSMVHADGDRTGRAVMPCPVMIKRRDSVPTIGEEVAYDP